jgi:hypothetical protein
MVGAHRVMPHLDKQPSGNPTLHARSQHPSPPTTQFRTTASIPTWSLARSCPSAWPSFPTYTSTAWLGCRVSEAASWCCLLLLYFVRLFSSLTVIVDLYLIYSPPMEPSLALPWRRLQSLEVEAGFCCVRHREEEDYTLNKQVRVQNHHGRVIDQMKRSTDNKKNDMSGFLDGRRFFRYRMTFLRIMQSCSFKFDSKDTSFHKLSLWWRSC